MPSSGNAKSGPGGTDTTRAPSACAPMQVRLERRLRHQDLRRARRRRQRRAERDERFRRAVAEIGDRGEQDAFVEAVGQHDAIGIDAEERRGLEDRVAKVGIGGERRAVEGAHGVDDFLRAAAGVFVEMQAAGPGPRSGTP